MAKIHELPDTLANQIAAGEVIERPASVVKELLENALDAHATQIDILIEGAGTQKIEIIDNGDGIGDDDVEIAFRRHATSKINNRQDLFKVKTLGFRGEALPSIASIADVELTTSTGETAGSYVHIKGGKILSTTHASARQGTSIKVTELFFNTPARLKYLKSRATELAKIVDIVNRLALSYPQVTFHLVHDGKKMLRTTGNGDIKRVIADIYGIDNARQMITINGQDNDFILTGYVSLPALTRASRDYISVLINGRYIKNFQLTKALIKGYGSKLMVGRYPFAVLNIQMDPLLVDVNVHPTKQEVRLSQEENLMMLLTNAVQKALSAVSLIPDGYQNLMGTRDTSSVKPTPNTPVNNNPATDFITSLNQASMKYQVEQGKAEANITTTTETQNVTPIMIYNRTDLLKPEVQAFIKRYPLSKPTSVGDDLSSSTTLTKSEQTSLVVEGLENIDSEATSGQTASDDNKPRWPELRYIGQMFGTFLFAEGPDGLYLIDQHAAQERINYEYYRTEIGEIGTVSQQLLIPLVLDYPTVDALKINDKLSILAELGLKLEPFGDNSFIMHAHPGWFMAGQVESITREIIDWVLRDGKLTVAQFREKTAIMMSCKRAIKANQHLSDLEAKALISNLGQTKNPFNCPHGRPVLVTLSLTDMEKMFKRIQDAHGSWIDYDSHPY